MKVLVKITEDVLKRSMFCGINPDTGAKIANTVSNVGRNCAIGVAICDLFQTAWVGNMAVYIYEVIPNYNLVNENATCMIIALPDTAADFIRYFDLSTPEERAIMKPFSFEIDVPSEVINSIGISEVYRVLSESHTLELVNL